MEKNKAPAARALASKIKKNYKKLSITPKNAFYGENKSACGARTGHKNRNDKKQFFTPNNAFYEEKKSACGVRTGRIFFLIHKYWKPHWMFVGRGGGEGPFQQRTERTKTNNPYSTPTITYSKRTKAHNRSNRDIRRNGRSCNSIRLRELQAQDRVKAGHVSPKTPSSQYVAMSILYPSEELMVSGVPRKHFRPRINVIGY